jgi:hypothetical protein
MWISSALPLSLLLLIDVQTAAADGVFSRSLRKAHGAAKRHTKSLAKDLRIAFGSVLVQQNPLDSSGNRVIYCKSGSSLNGGGQSGDGSDDDSGSGGGSNNGGNGTSTTRGSGTATATSSTPSATASTVDTPWKLVDTHVCYTKSLLLYEFVVLTRDCALSSKAHPSLTTGTFGRLMTQPTVRDPLLYSITLIDSILYRQS